MFKEMGQVPATSKADTYWLEKFEIPSKWEPAVQAALEKGDLSVEHKNALNRQLCTSVRAYHWLCHQIREGTHIRPAY